MLDDPRSDGSALRPKRPPRPPLSVAGAALLLKLASHPVRLQILLTLFEKEHDTRQLGEALDGHGLSAVSQHLTELRRAALVRPRRQGREKVHTLTEAGFRLVQAIRRIGHIPDPALEHSTAGPS